MSENSIEVTGLKKYFGHIKAVDDISFEVKQGIIFGMLGPNGAGKTTTIEILVGLCKRDAGQIKLLGLDPDKDALQLKEKIGVQLQSPALFSKLTVGELLKLFAGFYKNPFSEKKAIEMVGLEKTVKQFTASLSGGQRHRLAVALAIVSNADIYFLDEPTTGLDPQARRKLWDVIIELKSMGKTIFLTSHYMDEAETLCDDLLIIDYGKIIAKGSPKSLIEAYFGENIIEFINPSFTAEQKDALKNLVEVTRIGYHAEGKILLYTKNPAQTIAPLIEYAKSLDKGIDDLQIRKPTLEDLFLKLTGRMIKE